MRSLVSVRRAGFALPVTIVVAGALALGVVSAFTPRNSGAEAALERRRQLNAFALAQGGLERFLAERAALFHPGMPGEEETVRLKGVGGVAEIALRRIRPPVSGQPALFLVRSRGVVMGGRGPLAERTVAQLATWRPGGFQPLAAWTTLRAQAPAAADVSGDDHCGVVAPIAPVTADAGFDGIDWRGLVEGTALVRGAVHGADATSRYSTAEAWPIIRIDGDHELGSTGRGTLIVTGDLRIVGGHEWRGLILAGGRVELRRGARVRGAVVTGLNERFGVASPAADAIDARARVRFDSCDLAKAADAFGALELVPNTWVDG